MKLKNLALALTAVCAAPVWADNAVSLIPLPQTVKMEQGTFEFSKKLKTAVDAYPGDSIQWVLDNFEKNFTATTGVKFQTGKMGKAALQLKLNSSLAAEAYNLKVDEKQITIEAARPAGFFYALQTLQQLLPTRAVLAGKAVGEDVKLTLPAVSVSDAPKFGWRGFMLDEGRHFYGKEEIKKVLDVMAAYKMNRFHWHLTEDQGWRIEITKYPELTATGAWRNSKVLGWGDTKPDGQRYGGYYTQEDAREIVRYAKERFIEIVPEVDIPGHSQAAVASYPDFLACDPGMKHEVWLWQGVSPDVINVANPKACLLYTSPSPRDRG